MDHPSMVSTQERRSSRQPLRSFLSRLLVSRSYTSQKFLGLPGLLSLLSGIPCFRVPGLCILTVIKSCLTNILSLARSSRVTPAGFSVGFE